MENIKIPAQFLQGQESTLKIEKAETYLEGFLGESLVKAFLPWVAAKNRNRRMMTTRTIYEHGTYSSKESQKLSVTLLTKIDTELLFKIQ
jgi:hypothetical protein